MAVRRSVAWTSFGQASFIAMNFIGSIVVARLLGPFDIGVFAVAMAVVGLVGVIQSVGLDTFIVREAELTPDVLRSAAAVNLGISLVMAAVIAALGFAGGALFREPSVRDVLLVVAVVPIIGHYNFLPQAMMERAGAFRTLALVKAGSTALGLAITIALAARGYKVMSLAYSQLATAIITNLVVNIIAREHVTFRLSFTHWRRIARYGVQILAVSSMNRVASKISEIVLGRTLGLASLGLYSRSSNTTGQLWDSVHGVVGKVVFVDFTNEIRAGRPLRWRYLKVLEIMSGLMWPIFAGSAVLAGPVVMLVYGERWLGVATPLALLNISGIIFVSTTMTWEVLVLNDETARQVRLESVKTVIGTAFFIAGCFVSLEAAAAARIVDAIVSQILYRRHLIRLVDAPASAFGQVYRRSGLATLAAIGPALALMIVRHWSVHIALVDVVTVIVAGILLWLVALRATHHVLFEELRRVIRHVRPTEVTV